MLARMTWTGKPNVSVNTAELITEAGNIGRGATKTWVNPYKTKQAADHSSAFESGPRFTDFTRSEF